jgi:hypothetical protein
MSRTQQPKGTEEEQGITEQEVETKILHVLAIYPIISPTMLQGGLGPYMKPATWRPVLNRLIAEGKVEEHQESILSPSNRYNTYSKLSLPGVRVEMPKPAATEATVQG